MILIENRLTKRRNDISLKYFFVGEITTALMILKIEDRNDFKKGTIIIDEGQLAESEKC